MNKISTFAFFSSITMETWVQTEFESLYQRLEIVMKGENIRIVHNIKQGSTLLFGEGKTLTIYLNGHPLNHRLTKVPYNLSYDYIVELQKTPN